MVQGPCAGKAANTLPTLCYRLHEGAAALPDVPALRPATYLQRGGYEPRRSSYDERMPTRRKLQLTPEQMQAIARVLGEPRRFAILQQIARQPALQCSELGEHGTISAATISHHLKELQESGLVECEREGRTMRLSLRRDIWGAYLQELGSL